MKKVKSILLVGMYFMLMLVSCNAVSDSDSQLIKASGVVEATIVSLSPRIAGTVTEMYVAVGDNVSIGDPIMLIENETLQAQYNQVRAAYDSAQAALETAEAGLASAKAGVTVAEVNVKMANIQFQLSLQSARQLERPDRIKAWNAASPNEFDLPVWYFETSEEIDAAQAEVDAARETLRLERTNLDEVIESVSNADLNAAEERLAEAHAGFLVAEELQKRQAEQNGRKEVDAYVESLYDAAEAELTSAQAEYDSLISDVGADDLIEARARVIVADERYQIALDQWSELRVGNFSLEVGLARLGVEQAEALEEQSSAGEAQAQALVEQARQGVSQAQAALDLVEVQIADLQVTSTASGVILARSVEVGEAVQPGMMTISIGKLEDLTITVYVSEDQYGMIKLGQSAEVTVDSFPDEVFTAAVSRIANQAEYTPRNVQTEEDRSTTVFAIELSVGSTDGKLKPGMPADVSFSN